MEAVFVEIIDTISRKANMGRMKKLECVCGQAWLPHADPFPTKSRKIQLGFRGFLFWRNGV